MSSESETDAKQRAWLRTRVENDFTYHSPDQNQISRMAIIREQAKTLGKLIVDYCPLGREQSTALTLLEQVSMMANASIVREENEKKV